MNLTESTSSSITAIVDFVCALVFKDEVKAFENETHESAEAAAVYTSAIFKTDGRSEPERQTIIENYVELNPYYKELQDKHGIDPYIARFAKDLDIIKQNETMISRYSYLYHYRTTYKDCLNSFFVTSYSQAMITKPNYREFCLLSINIMAIMNLLHRWLETPFDIEIMDETQIDRFMVSFGISFFRNLPLKYKILIAKNLNRLITRKGTDKVIIDILEIFNFRDIDIYKYYLARNATSSVVGRPETTDYLENTNRDAYFIAHKIDIESLNVAIKNDEYKKFDYDRITATDPYWQASKAEVRSLNFDYVQTKYFSIETSFEVGAESMNTILMLNLLKRIREDYPSRELLNISSNYISEQNSVSLEDIIVTLQVLTCDHQGVVDAIQYDLDSIATVHDFAKVDFPSMNEQLYADNPSIFVNSSGPAIRNLGDVGVFDTPNVNSVFSDNIAARSKIEEAMKRETVYSKYRRLKNAYNAKFTQKLSYEIFNPYVHFSEYVQSRSPDLYAIIENTRAIEDEDERRMATEEAISALSDVANSALDKFGLFFGSTSVNIVVEYMKTVIMAFKSFTVSLNDLSVFIVIHDRYEYKLLDELNHMATMLFTEDRLGMADKWVFRGVFDLESQYRLLDRVNIIETEGGTPVTSTAVQVNKSSPSTAESEVASKDSILGNDSLRIIRL